MERPCCTISEAQCYTLRLWWKPFIHQFCKWSHFAFDKVMHECTLVSTGMLQLSSCTSVFTFYSLKKRKGWIETHWSITNIWMFSFGTWVGGSFFKLLYIPEASWAALQYQGQHHKCGWLHQGIAAGPLISNQQSPRWLHFHVALMQRRACASSVQTSRSSKRKGQQKSVIGQTVNYVSIFLLPPTIKNK